MTEAFLNYLQYEKRYSSKTVTSYQTDLLQFFLFIENIKAKGPDGTTRSIGSLNFIINC